MPDGLSLPDLVHKESKGMRSHLPNRLALLMAQRLQDANAEGQRGQERSNVTTLQRALNRITVLTLFYNLPTHRHHHHRSHLEIYTNLEILAQIIGTANRRAQRLGPITLHLMAAQSKQGKQPSRRMQVNQGTQSSRAM